MRKLVQIVKALAPFHDLTLQSVHSPKRKRLPSTL